MAHIASTLFFSAVLVGSIWGIYHTFKNAK